MNVHREHLARRLAEAADFLACALAEFARSERLDDDGLALRLGCTRDVLTSLRLCRAPRTMAPQFWQDVQQIARRFAVDADVLAEMARRGQSLWQLRHAAQSTSEGHRFLLAARDGAAEEPYGGEPS